MNAQKSLDTLYTWRMQGTNDIGYIADEAMDLATTLLKEREALLTCIRESIKDIEEGCYAMDALARLRAALEV